MAAPIIVSINDVPNAQPVIQVKGAPNGYDIYTGDLVADPAIEDGALITLFGVDTGGSIADWGGRFMDPTPWQALPPWEPYGDGVNYRQYRTAVDIVWVQHDIEGPFGNGDLQVAFNSAHPGTWYFNPGVVNNEDENLGPVTDQWVTVYENDLLVVRYKPHTYVAKGYVPYQSAIQVQVVEESYDPVTELTTKVLEGQGNSSHMGAVTVWAQIEIDAGEYDPAGPSWVSHFSGIEIETATNGATVESTIQGVETVPLPVPSPFMGYITGTRTVTGGTGRFEGASGFMTIEGVDSDGVTLDVKGVISSVGATKK